MKNKNELIDLYVLYRNYIFSINEIEEYGDKYGDTKEIIQMYEEKLQEYDIKIKKKNI